MNETDGVFAGALPALYDRFLAPLLFEPYAVDLAERLGDLAQGRLLETAAGTGVVTRALLRTLPEHVAIVATDLNQPMLDLAMARTRARNVTWRQADAQVLPFENQTFDAVVCQFGVMFFPDRRAAYREALRVLRPGGRFVFNTWDRIEENDLSRIVTEALAALFPDDPPRFLARIPCGYHDAAGIRDELRKVGFARITVDTIERRSRAPSPREAVIGLCQGSPLRHEIEARDPRRLAEATAAAEAAVVAHFGRGPVDGRTRAHVVTALR